MTRHFKSDCATSKHHPIICAYKHKPWWLSRKMVHEQSSETHAVLFSCSRSLYVEHGYTVTALTFMWGWHSLSRNLIFDVHYRQAGQDWSTTALIFPTLLLAFVHGPYEVHNMWNMKLSQILARWGLRILSWDPTLSIVTLKISKDQC